MALTEALRERRRGYLGASDVAKVLGLSKWGKPVDVFYNKVAGIDPDENEAMREGNRLEPVVIEWASEQLGVPIVTDPEALFVTNEQYPWLCANLDGLAETDILLPVEAKSHGIVGQTMHELWGPDGTDEVPDDYWIQCQMHMLVKNTSSAKLAALIGNRGFVMYHIDRHDAFCEMAISRTKEFWYNHIVPKEIPPGTPSMDTLKKLPRIEGKVVSVPFDLMERYAVIRQQIAVDEKIKEEIQAEIVAAMGDAEKGEAKKDGVLYRAAYKMVHRDEYTVKAQDSRRFTLTTPRQRALTDGK